MPTPPAAAWISTVSPARRRPSVVSAWCAVMNANGSVAASAKPSPGGIGATCRWSVVA